MHNIITCFKQFHKITGIKKPRLQMCEYFTVSNRENDFIESGRCGRITIFWGGDKLGHRLNKFLNSADYKANFSYLLGVRRK